jgi:hypothetical protein
VRRHGGLVVLATAASLVAGDGARAHQLRADRRARGLAAAAAGLALRALVLQYIALSSVGAYSTLYRGSRPRAPSADAVAVRRGARRSG